MQSKRIVKITYEGNHERHLWTITRNTRRYSLTGDATQDTSQAQPPYSSLKHVYSFLQCKFQFILQIKLLIYLSMFNL